ncbi:latrophilin-like protein LAT-2 [Haliotis cracherodii]|uniref:latrophilin-like protein LAT-2 n=1 Tax=Haliotis cracherodii TaxID=6455 RepID=UPI0039EC5E79
MINGCKTKVNDIIRSISLQDRCHEILCPPFQQLKNRECKGIFAPFFRMSKHFIDIFLVPIVTKTSKTVNLTHLTCVLTDYYISQIPGNDTALQKVVVIVNFNNLSHADLSWNNHTDGDDYSRINAFGNFNIDIRIYFAVNFTFGDSFAVFAERLSNLLFGDVFLSDEAMNITLRALYKDMLPTIRYSTNHTSVYDPDVIGEDAFEAFPSTYIKRNCPQILYSQSDYTLMANASALLGNNRSLIPDDSFTLTEDLGILVCLSTLENFTLDSFTPVLNNDSRLDKKSGLEQSYDILTILTTVSLSFSMFFLALSFLVYATLTTLHTLPGCILMCLMGSLFVAQGLFLFGAGAHDNLLVCKIIGVLTHYFWMVTFAWMGVNTFHVFRVFRNILSSVNLSGNKRKIFCKYVAFVYMVPGVIVGLTILTNLFLFGKSTIGYSERGAACFLNPGVITLISFGIPIFVIVVGTFAFFISTVTSLRRLSKERVQAGQKEQGTILHMLKIASVSCMSWVFGLLGSSFSIEAFNYAFVILAGGQGLLIFLSFVCNSRVLKLCMKGKTRPSPCRSKDVNSKVTLSSNVSSDLSSRE